MKTNMAYVLLGVFITIESIIVISIWMIFFPEYTIVLLALALLAIVAISKKLNFKPGIKLGMKISKILDMNLSIAKKILKK